MDENDVIDDFGESVAELDDLDFEPKPENQPTEPPVNSTVDNQQDTQPEEDFITVLLKSKGIEDKSKIKFENEEGDVEELSWDSLSNEERMNIKLPYIMTEALINEAINLSQEWREGKVKLTEPRTGTKDIIVSFAYGNYVSSLIINDLEKQDNNDEIDLDEWSWLSGC